MRRARERDIAFVFQLFALYPHMNVRRNIAFPLIAQGESRAEIRSPRQEAAKLLRLEHLLDRPVSGLAGGDRQRVALGRAIVRRPKCFLMDEPLGTLDAELREIMVRDLRELHNRIHATTVYVTHDQMEAMAMADKIAVMNHGIIEQYATPQEIYARPASMYVADFIGAPPMNFIRFQGQAASGAETLNLNGRDIRVPRLLEDSGATELALGIRPEHIRFSDGGELRGSVLAVEYLGTTQIVSVDIPEGKAQGAHRRRHAGQPRRDRRHRARQPAAVGLRRRTGRALRSALTTGRGMAEVSLQGLSKSFGRTRAVAGPDADHRRRRIRRAARPDRRRQDHDAAADRRHRAPRRRHDQHRRRAGRAAGPGRARRLLRLPAIFALPAPERPRQPRLPAQGAGPRPVGGRDRTPASPRSRGWCASSTSSTTGRPGCRAARCSASPSAAPWCASRTST